MLFDSNQQNNAPKPRSPRAPEVNPESFFENALPHSILKADIVSKYIIGWANIIVRGALKYNKDARVYVVDLFSGPGQYNKDGVKSTPVKAVEKALLNAELTKNIIFRFNDNSEEMISRLQGNVNSIPGATSFKYPIKYTSLDAESEEVASWFKKNASGKQLPMLVFIDPFGYKQLSRELLRTIIQIPKSDILFFFNYRRINAALDNEQFTSNMNKMFGDERVKTIKEELGKARQPSEREKIILKHLEESLIEIGAVHVAPFVVVQEDAEHTSHYIVGITKHPKGYELLKKIMRQHSEIGEHGQAFGYNPASKAKDSQHSLFGSLPDRIEILAAKLAQDYKGRAVLFEQLYLVHHPKTEYTEAEYKHAIRRLLASGRAYNPDEDATIKRKTIKGEQAIPNHLKIKFT